MTGENYLAIRPVVLDTNAILMPFTQGTRLEEDLAALFGRVTLHVPTSVISELKHLSANKGETGRAARMALTFSERCKLEPTGPMLHDRRLPVAPRRPATSPPPAQFNPRPPPVIHHIIQFAIRDAEVPDHAGLPTRAVIKVKRRLYPRRRGNFHAFDQNREIRPRHYNQVDIRRFVNARQSQHS